MKHIFFLLLPVFMFSCGDNQTAIIEEEVIEEVDLSSIDSYVNEKMSDSQEYDVAMSLRFAKGDDTYEVVQYQQEGEIIILLETEMQEGRSVVRQSFFKDNLPVFVSEFFSINTVETEPFIQRQVYINESSVIGATERKAFSEDELEMMAFEPIEVQLKEFDFNRPVRAINQQGEFALQFEEFLIIDPQTYLILGNKESGYDAALFVSEQNELLTEMNQNQADYRGKTMHVYHQFVLTNGIERMLYIDGEILED